MTTTELLALPWITKAGLEDVAPDVLAPGELSTPYLVVDEDEGPLCLPNHEFYDVSVDRFYRGTAYLLGRACAWSDDHAAKIVGVEKHKRPDGAWVVTCWAVGSEQYVPATYRCEICGFMHERPWHHHPPGSAST